MIKIFKKTLAVCILGLGVGILLVLFLPFTWWLFLIGIALIGARNCMACVLNLNRRFYI